MASPLSVGDCISIVSVAIQAYGAISDSSDDAKALTNLTGDLQQLKEILEELSTSGQLEVGTANIRNVLSRCKTAVSDAEAVLKRYKAEKGRPSTSWRRIAWSFSGKKKVAPLQARIQSLVASFGLVQREIIRFVRPCVKWHNIHLSKSNYNARYYTDRPSETQTPMASSETRM